MVMGSQALLTELDQSGRLMRRKKRQVHPGEAAGQEVAADPRPAEPRWRQRRNGLASP